LLVYLLRCRRQTRLCWLVYLLPCLLWNSMQPRPGPMDVVWCFWKFS
jgi:hypothetical protein